MRSEAPKARLLPACFLSCDPILLPKFYPPPPYFPSITPYNQAEAPLLPTVHRNPSSFSGWMFPSLALCFGWSRMFLGSNTRFCISSTVGSCEQRPLHNLISDSKSLRTECSNQTASSCFLLMLLLPEVTKSNGYESRAVPVAFQAHWPALGAGAGTVAGSCLQLHLCFQNNATLKIEKGKAITVYPG